MAAAAPRTNALGCEEKRSWALRAHQGFGHGEGLGYGVSADGGQVGRREADEEVLGM